MQDLTNAELVEAIIQANKAILEASADILAATEELKRREQG